MARFRFRLETLLKVRKERRDQLREDLAKANQAATILAAQRQEILAELETTVEEMRREQLQSSPTVDRIIENRRYGALLKIHVATIEDQARQIAEEVEKRRQALANADRDVRVIEKLKEKQLQQYYHKEDIAETKMLDELAGIQSFRRRDDSEADAESDQ